MQNLLPSLFTSVKKLLDVNHDKTKIMLRHEVDAQHVWLF